MIGYLKSLRSHSLVGTLRHLIMNMMQSSLKALNEWSDVMIYSVECVYDKAYLCDDADPSVQTDDMSKSYN